MITICLTYFRSLELANLRAALYSVRRQNLSQVEEIIVVDNNTNDSVEDIRSVVRELDFPVRVSIFSYKHGDPTKTHPWSVNRAVEAVETDWFILTRADYLLDFNAVERFLEVPQVENRFIVGGYYDVGMDVYRCDLTPWKEAGPVVLQSYGREWDHVTIDAGVWMTSTDVFHKIGGMRESLYAWGHAQTVFQFELHRAGVECVRIPHVVFYHTAHGYETPRNHTVARQQLEMAGFNLIEMWSRYSGPDNPYR